MLFRYLLHSKPLTERKTSPISIIYSVYRKSHEIGIAKSFGRIPFFDNFQQKGKMFMHIDNEKRLLSLCTKYLIRVSRYYANHTITLITLDLCKLVNVCTDSYECYGVLGIKRTRLKRFTKAHIITEYAMQWYSIMIDGMLYILKSSSVKEAETAFKHLTDNLKDEIDENRTDVLSERSETSNGETQKVRSIAKSIASGIYPFPGQIGVVGDIFQTPENSERSEGGESNDSPSVPPVST